MLTEEQLIKGCFSEDAASQKGSVYPLCSRMYGVCKRYARNAADVGDILQNAFIKIRDKIPR
jgi:DNA-directed RNA polymerase specialized sigma24 family protein